MGRKVKLSIDFKQFGDLIEKIDRMNGDVKGVINDCLTQSRDLVTTELKNAMQKHNRTHRTESSIRDNNTVEWKVDEASLKVGFDLTTGGMPSIFLMHGTPRVKKDTKLYNAVYGAKIKKQIKELQTKIFNDYINQYLGG